MYKHAYSLHIICANNYMYTDDLKKFAILKKGISQGIESQKTIQTS